MGIIHFLSADILLGTGSVVVCFIGKRYWCRKLMNEFGIGKWIGKYPAGRKRY
jgi:hypothetical protein